MLRILLVGPAGLPGTLRRHWLSGAVSRRCGGASPSGAPAVNLPGRFAAGLLFHFMQGRRALSGTARAAASVGRPGGFTTSSAYGSQTFALRREGRPARAALDVVASSLPGLLPVWAGRAAARLPGGA